VNKVIHILLLLVVFSGYSNLKAQEADSLNVPGYQTFSLLSFKYLWLQTTNPASIYFVTDDIGKVDFTYHNIQGDYREPTEPSKISALTVNSEGYSKYKKLSFYGTFDYELAKLNNRKWSNVLFLSPLNPYTLADSIGGDYDREVFRIQGGIASSAAGNKIQWGILATYQVGSSADQKDPRPLINATRYSLRPGVIYQMGKWALGIDLLAEGYKEKIDIDVVNYNVTNHYFLFMGLGNYSPQSGDSYTRNYSGNTIQGNLQLYFRGNDLENIMQVGYQKIFETARDGAASNGFKGGDFKSNQINLQNTLKIIQPQSIHFISFKTVYDLPKGIWYDQKLLTGPNNTTYWEVYNQSVRFKQNILNLELVYSFIKLKNTLKNYSLGATASFTNNKSECFPEKYSVKFSNVYFEINGNKAFYTKKRSEVSIGFKTGYRKNLTTENVTEGIKLQKIITLPGLWYNTVNSVYLGATLAAGKKVIVKDQKILPYLEINAGSYFIPTLEKYYSNSQRLAGTIKFGIIF
jgi:hypothetical protein